MSSVDSILDTACFAEWCKLQTMSAKAHLNSQLSQWVSHQETLSALSARFKRFKLAFQRDPKFYEECYEIFKEIAGCETELNTLINSDSKLEKESYGEILFFRPILQPLNFLPCALSIWAFIRVYLLPGLSFLVPILTLLAPYIIVRFIFNVPMTLQNYSQILQSMVAGNFTQIMNPSATPVASASSTNPFGLIKQLGIVAVTLVQGIIQPYWTYKHLNSIDSIILTHGEIITRFKELYTKLESVLEKRGLTFFKCPIPEFSTEREAIAQAMLNPSYFKLALKYIGTLEVLMALANQRDIYPVKWISSNTPVFRITDTYDFQVPMASRKTISVEFSQEHHALLTGPNKGGKSTVLRALSTSALLAHTYGAAIGQLELTPFTKMFVCLKPDDLPGSKSRFEREIEFTAATLKYSQPILVLIDELYHSTNPPDALRSCDIYCQQLWNKSNVISVISTHLFELVDKSPAHIKRICCPAIIDSKGDIHFEYVLKTGICKVSSVDELLRLNGLIIPRAPESETKIPQARQNDVAE
jgi:energy-coupling factor transporter ATP-binding protein EcfA2